MENITFTIDFKGIFEAIYALKDFAIFSFIWMLFKSVLAIVGWVYYTKFIIYLFNVLFNSNFRNRNRMCDQGMVMDLSIILAILSYGYALHAMGGLNFIFS